MTQILLDSSKLTQLKTATSIEEMQAMIAQLEKNITELPETPNQAYSRLNREFAYLSDSVINHQQATEKYGVGNTTLFSWEQKGFVKVVQKARRRGLPTFVSEKDIAVMVEMNKLFRTGRSGPIPGWKPQFDLIAS